MAPKRRLGLTRLLRVHSYDIATDPRGPVVFDVLFGRYARYVAGLAERLLGKGDAEVDDVVQDVFWLASRRLTKIPDLIQARGWLATVTTRLVCRRIKRRRFRALFLAKRRPINVPAPGATADEHAILARLYDVMGTLPAKQQMAWSLRYLEGQSLGTVAQTCGCSLSTVKRRLDAAKDVIDRVFADD